MKNILVVDDHPDLRMLVRMTLELGDYSVTEARDAVSADASVRADRPDLVLLDIMMPGAFDGLELCRRIKADPALRATRVVLLTARGSQEDRNAARTAGADHFLVKPFKPSQLLEIVGQLCAASHG